MFVLIKSIRGEVRCDPSFFPEGEISVSLFNNIGEMGKLSGWCSYSYKTQEETTKLFNDYNAPDLSDTAKILKGVVKASSVGDALFKIGYRPRFPIGLSLYFFSFSLSFLILLDSNNTWDLFLCFRSSENTFK